MHLYVELWNPKQKWLDLSTEERQQYVGRVGPGIQKLQEAGVELVGFALNDADTPHRSDYAYIAVWKMPGPEQVSLLENILDEAGWHDHFAQVNARGQMQPPPEVLGHMVQSPSRS